jgi:hypothetical protein
MASAWVTKKALAERGVTEVAFFPIDYGVPVPWMDAVGCELYSVDFCPELPDLLTLADVCTRVTVIDHHKSARRVIAALEAHPRDNVRFDFDMAHAGGHLCWRHFFPEQTPPAFVRYTEDRDLWTWKLPYSKEISAYLSTLPWGDFRAWDAAANGLEVGLVNSEFWMVPYGRVVLEFQERMIEDHLRASFETVLDGHKVRAANCSCAAIHSELTGRLAEGRSFGVSWFVRQDGKAQVSLRSRGEDPFDVTQVTTRYGGGGHTQAGGFQVPAGALPFATPTVFPTGGQG